MKRILIVKTTSMGDVIHALPVLHDIHVRYPAILIDWMVEEPFADLVRSNPWVNEVVRVNVRVWRRLGMKNLFLEWRKLRVRLADREYDLVIDLQGLLKSALLACAAKGPRAGASLSCVREKVACFFYGRRAAWNPRDHAVERLRVLVGGLLGYAVSGPPVFYGEQALVLAQSMDARIVWFLHATARDEKKWPIEHWRALAKRLIEQGCRVQLPWGSDAERKQAETIAVGFSQVEVLPKMSLALLQEKLPGVSLVVGVDTGLTHLAAALHRPLVALFFATPAWRFAPRFNPKGVALGDVGQMPSVNEVFQASAELLQANRS